MLKQLGQALIETANALQRHEEAIAALSDRIKTLEEPKPVWRQRFERIYETALVFYALRTNYKFGAEWGNDQQFDCSSFMQLIYGLWGVSLPRVSRDQASQGVAVPFDQIRPGDILFFDTNGDGTINHVGMAIDNGDMIHTNNPTDDVNIKPYVSGYWLEKFVTARRVLE